MRQKDNLFFKYLASLQSLREAIASHKRMDRDHGVGRFLNWSSADSRKTFAHALNKALTDILDPTILSINNNNWRLYKHYTRCVGELQNAHDMLLKAYEHATTGKLLCSGSRTVIAEKDTDGSYETSFR